MNPPKPKAKDTSSPAASPDRGLLGSDAVGNNQQQFSALVGSIAKRYGVKVAVASGPVKNPYAMSPEQAAKIALRAGIITRTGNLNRTFK